MPQRRCRRVVVYKPDVIVLGGVGGLEIDAETLRLILDTDARVLWAFIKKDGVVQPVAYDESRVLWLEDSDLERVDAAEETQ